MSQFQTSQSNIHVIARGFFRHKDMVVLCRAKGSRSFFLPGGHIEDGESARVALVRELCEEMGPSEYKVSDFLGVCENVFPLKKNILQHEINLVFKVEVPNDFVVRTQEDHIEFVSVKKRELRNYEILPVSIKEGILKWLENRELFFKEI